MGRWYRWAFSVVSMGLVFVIYSCGGQTVVQNGPTAEDSGQPAMTVQPDGATVMTLPDGAVVPVPPPIDGSTPGSGEIRCGASMCNAATQVCCASGNTMPACVDAGQCKGTSLACTSPANCGSGDVCCYDGAAEMASCTAEASCGGIIICASSNDCPAGETCQIGGRGGLRLCLPGGPTGGFDGGFRRDGGPSFPHDGGRGPADASGD